ncbi:MAG: M24 family metallopeptidase, partial [Actinobacteria bacterium]|nr:M24 family metallopeptidase [Actinomycetota bacterium]
ILFNNRLYFSGQNEIEVWNQVKGAVTQTNGEEVIIFGELITGQRPKPLGFLSGPLDRKIEKGDLGMIDLSNRCRGYWADCSNVVVFGSEPSEQQKRYTKIVNEAYQAILNTIKPGVRCCDVDAVAHKVFNSFGFKFLVHTGHQIGCTVNELPRMVSYNTSPIEKNMVFSLEPQIYTGDFDAVCYRLEKVVIVTDTGVDELSTFKWGILD